MSEGAPKPERYKSKWDEEGNFIWKDGVSFSLSIEHDCYFLTVFNEVEGVSVMSGQAVLRPRYKGNELKSFYVVSFRSTLENEGNAANLLECINSFLDYQNKSGHLSNDIGSMRKSPVNSGQNLLDKNKRGLYRNHGWEGNVKNNDMHRNPKKDSE